MSGPTQHPDDVNVLRRIVRGIDRGFTFLEEILFAVACLALAVIMLLIVYSAGSRYLFDRPFEGSQVWVAEFLAPTAVFFALAATLRMRRHIGVTFAVRKLPVGIRLIVEGIAAALTAVVFLTVAYEGAVRAVAAYRAGYIESIVGVPLWCAYIVVPIGAAFIGLRAVIICLQWCVGDRDHVSLSETRKDTELAE